MKNIIIPSAAVLALIAFTKKNRNTPTKAQSIEQNATQTTAAATLPTKTIGNVENYSSMKISEWSDIYKNQYINSDPETAANYVWNLWINERNPHSALGSTRSRFNVLSKSDRIVPFSGSTAIR